MPSMQFFTRFITASIVLSTAPALAKDDACLRALKGKGDVASSFCDGYTKGLSHNSTRPTSKAPSYNTTLPTYLSDCSYSSSRISSACSCYVTPAPVVVTSTPCTSVGGPKTPAPGNNGNNNLGPGNGGHGGGSNGNPNNGGHTGGSNGGSGGGNGGHGGASNGSPGNHNSGGEGGGYPPNNGGHNGGGDGGSNGSPNGPKTCPPPSTLYVTKLITATVTSVGTGVCPTCPIGGTQTVTIPGGTVTKDCQKPTGSYGNTTCPIVGTVTIPAGTITLPGSTITSCPPGGSNNSTCPTAGTVTIPGGTITFPPTTVTSCPPGGPNNSTCPTGGTVTSTITLPPSTITSCPTSPSNSTCPPGETITSTVSSCSTGNSGNSTCPTVGTVTLPPSTITVGSTSTITVPCTTKPIDTSCDASTITLPASTITLGNSTVTVTGPTTTVTAPPDDGRKRCFSGYQSVPNLRNGGFESGSSSWQWDGASSTHIGPDDPNGWGQTSHGGIHWLTSARPATLYQDDLDLCIGGVYLLQAYIANAYSDGLAVQLCLGNVCGANTVITARSPDWQLVSTLITWTQNDFLYYPFRIVGTPRDAGGPLLYDDISITRIDSGCRCWTNN